MEEHICVFDFRKPLGDYKQQEGNHTASFSLSKGMGSFINFKNFGDITQPDHSNGKPMGTFLLARQSSIYSLTFDELQNTFGGPGKDFGSMNMEDLLKNIWTAEESQALAASSSSGVGITHGGNFQRQGSLTLPRTLSQKTVDEVLRDMFKENDGDTKDVSVVGGSTLGPTQPTLGEMTLEEFLQKAGVANEDMQQTMRPNVGGFFGSLAQPCNDTSGVTIGFQQPNQNQRLLGNQFMENGNAMSNSSNIMLNLSGVRTYQQQRHQAAQSQEQPIFPKQSTVAFSSGAWLGNNAQLDSPGAKVPVGISNSSASSAIVQGGLMHSPGAKVPVAGISNSSIMSSTVAQSGVMQRGATGLTGLNNIPTSVAAKSPGNHLSSEVAAKSTMDKLIVSPSPYACAEGGQGRRSGSSLEKVVERRRKRMIKNRESAARSRARKQAYTLELEAEITKLKEINQELLKKQAELMELQKNQMSETVKMPWGGKKIFLRRTLTGPW